MFSARANNTEVTIKQTRENLLLEHVGITVHKYSRVHTALSRSCHLHGQE